MKRSIKFSIIMILFLVILIFVVKTVSSVDSSFSISNVYYREFVFENSITEDETEFVENAKKIYGLSEKEATELFCNRDDYVNIVLWCTIENKSILPMYIINTFSTNFSDVFICKERPESLYLCFIQPGDSTTIPTNIILKKNEFNSSFFEKLKVNIFSLGIPFVLNAKFGEYYQFNDTDIDEITMELSFPENFAKVMKYYQPVRNSDEKYTLDEYNSLAYNYPRISENRVYTSNKFLYKGIKYNAFAFFDENGVLEQGIVFSSLREKNEKNEFESVMTLSDVLKLEPECIIFEEANTKKSYHYFNDGICVVLTYDTNNIITSTNELNVDYIFKLLTTSDSSLIEDNQ